MLKILHLAPQNYAGVPYNFYEMHNKCGDYSRLITYHKNPRNFPEDICLNLALPNFKAAKKWREKKIDEKENNMADSANYFTPKNMFEKSYFILMDLFRKKKIEHIVEKYELNEFDIIHYDAGLDLFRDSSLAKTWKEMGKKIVCCYYGSDLRIRGIIKELDEISDLNITSEFDHLKLKKDIQYLFYPYSPSELPAKEENNSSIIRVIHSPTNRQFKGTELIISVIEKIKKEKKIEFLLFENLDRNKLLKIKSTCDICIDQVGGIMGGTGYGKAGLETLAMGLPTITNMTEDYKNWIPENPFVIANNEDELYFKLNELIDSKERRTALGDAGIKWVQKYHGYQSVNIRLKDLYKKHNII